MRHHSQETAPSLYVQAAKDAFRKLDPRVLVRNPVMFVVAVGCVFTTASFFSRVVTGADAGFSGQISLWLWFTVLFANFAEALAEGRGKAQADTLRSARTDTVAHRLLSDGTVETVSASELAPGDRVVVEAGDMIPADGTVVEGVAAVDESAITGESAPVIRESGGDRSAVTGGTTVLSDRIVVNVTQEPGKSFLDRMIALVEGAERQKTPNEIALNILLAGLTLIFMLVVVTLKPLGLYHGINIDMVVLVALLVCLIPTTISGLLAAIGIAGMDRLLQRNVLALSGRAVEAAGDVDVLLLDKTGTITLGNRMASAFLPLPGVNIDEMMQAACLASSGDETPEGRSIVELGNTLGVSLNGVPQDVVSVPFTAETRMSGVDAAGEQLRKGATDSVLQWVHSLGLPERREELKALVDPVAREGGTPLVVASSTRGVLGVIQLKDVVKPGMRDRFDRIRAMGIKTVMITGDNRLTAQAIAAEAGVDDFLAEAKPEDKLQLILDLQKEGRAGQVRRGAGHEHRHAGRPRGREHDRPRFRPHQAHRDRGDRQAASDYPGRAHHVQPRQRRGQVLRHHPGAVHGGPAGARRAERHAPVHAAERHPVRSDLQRPDHHPAHPAGAQGRALPSPFHGFGPARQPVGLRARRRHRPVHRHQAH